MTPPQLQDGPQGLYQWLTRVERELTPFHIELAPLEARETVHMVLSILAPPAADCTRATRAWSPPCLSVRRFSRNVYQPRELAISARRGQGWCNRFPGRSRRSPRHRGSTSRWCMSWPARMFRRTCHRDNRQDRRMGSNRLIRRCRSYKWNQPSHRYCPDSRRPLHTGCRHCCRPGLLNHGP